MSANTWVNPGSLREMAYPFLYEGTPKLMVIKSRLRTLAVSAIPKLVSIGTSIPCTNPIAICWVPAILVLSPSAPPVCFSASFAPSPANTLASYSSFNFAPMNEFMKLRYPTNLSNFFWMASSM